MNALSEAPRLLLLMPASLAAQARAAVAARGGFGEVAAVEDLPGLRAALARGRWDVLLSFGTGVVVPADVLRSTGLHAFNIHAASPAYPGRDPHHFAAYDGAAVYGATLHRMTETVDQGEVLWTQLVPVPPGAAPDELLRLGNACGLQLMRRLLDRVAAGQWPERDTVQDWSGPVRRRRDFLALCRVTPDMSQEEFERRLHACRMPGYANLWLELHGRRFRLDGPA